MSTQHRRPHMVFFIPESWRGDMLGHMGDPAAVTPNLDRLAISDGVSFRNAFCQNPVCTPSRCSFMSGWYPHVHGHRTMRYMMRGDEPVLLRTLKEEGYFVWWGGKNDLVPGQNGYDAFCDVMYRIPADAPRALRRKDWRGPADGDNYYSFYEGKIDKDPAVTEYHDNDWGLIRGAVEQIRNRPVDRPLCIYLPLGFIHCPYGVEEPWFSMIDRSKLPPRTPVEAMSGPEPAIRGQLRGRIGMVGWSEDRWTELKAAYYGMAARTDHQFGMVMDVLREAGIYDETAVFVFSDHGDYTGDYGLVEKTENTFEDCLSRVPFIVKPPADAPCRPGIRDALVELVDFPATVEAITGIAPRWRHFGRSLLPLIAGETDEHRDAVFCEGGRIRGEKESLNQEREFGRDDPYWPRASVMTDDTGADGKAVMCRTCEYKYVYRLYETDELYDLLGDPAEAHNLIDDPEHQSVAQCLRERVMQFLVETGDVVPFDQDRRN